MKEKNNYSDSEEDNDSKKKDIIDDDLLKISISEEPNKLINSNISLIKNNENIDLIESNYKIKNNENIEIKESINNIKNDNEIENIELIKINEIEKIVCPECGEMPSLEINHENYMIKSFCPNKHSIEDSLFNFIKRSNEKLSEDILCSECKKKSSDLKNKKNDLYKCKCGNYICKDCKNKHEDEKSEEENENEDDEDKKHNLLEYSEKDYKCTCSESLEDYYFYCNKCMKNLCVGCEAEHPKDHQIFDFSDLIDNYLSEKDIASKKKKFKEQINAINIFINKLNAFKKKLEEKINSLENALQTFLEINNYILKKFNKKAMNYQIIESVKNINLEIPELITYFTNSTDEKESLTFLINIVDYQNKKDKNFNMDYKSSSNRSSVNISKSSGKSFDDNIGSKITSICQLKNGIAVGDINGKIHCFTLTKNQLIKNLIISDDNEKDIKYLYLLKNGNFISSIYNEFKIYELTKSNEKIGYKIIQQFKYSNVIKQEKKIIKDNKSNKSNKSNLEVIQNFQNNYHYQVLELTNGFLLYIEADRLYYLKPCNNKSNYEDKPKKEKLKSNIISMAELNNNKFCLYCEDKFLYIYDSKTFKEKSKISSKCNYNKIKCVSNDIIAALGDNKIFLISEANKNIVDSFMDCNIYDIDVGLNKIFAVNDNNLIQFDINVNKEGKYFTKKEDIQIKCKANILYLLNNEVDKTDEIGKIAFAYNNEWIRVLLF